MHLNMSCIPDVIPSGLHIPTQSSNKKQIISIIIIKMASSLEQRHHISATKAKIWVNEALVYKKRTEKNSQRTADRQLK